MSLQQSTAQTFGPYFAIGLKRVEVGIPADAAQLKLIIRGRVLDGDGKPVGDAAIETWQANLQGRYPAQPTFGAAPAHADLTGLGRAPTDAEGRFEIHTYKPGPVPGPGGALQAPHILVAVGMRGLLRHLVTRMYFPDEASNSQDAVLQGVPAERRATLVAKAAGKNELSWDVALQGDNETVFFDC